MNRWTKIGIGVAGAGLAVAAMFLGGSKTQAIDDSNRVAAQVKEGKLIVHEWGTFTSFSGSNGVQLDFRPLIHEDLPDFVFDRRMQAGVPLLTKSLIRARVRMETPVTYFYTDEERTIRASVEFPDGLLTEFYPPVASMTPKYDMTSSKQAFGKSKLDWGEIDLIPAAKFAPAVKDPKTRRWLSEMIEQRVVPNDGRGGNHYFRARETDSAFVHIRHSASAENPLKPAGEYLEKFLFYRGVGRFEQPLQAVVADDGRVKVTNPGSQVIRSLFKVNCASGELTYSVLETLAAGATAEFPQTDTKVTLPELQDQVCQALVRENLYPREATAMVNTWADSWFAEEGTRIFYMVPREVTDKLLPLTISPTPDESVRVLVGRVEVMSPSLERQLLEVVRKHAEKRVAVRKQADADEKPMPELAVPAELLKLGRLSEPALLRIHELASDNAISWEATVLMNECRIALEKQSTEELRPESTESE